MTKQRHDMNPWGSLVAHFSTAVLDAPEHYSLGMLDAPDAPATDNPSLKKRLRVFRVGKHTDSKGRVRDWTHADLDETVKNFNTLRNNGILPNVPVRIDHTEKMRDVVGYFTDVYRDPAEPDFLFADVEFTEPDALGKYERKTLRNRSIEIGAYKANDGTVYSPVVVGLAWVDLPAVEGLFGINRGQEASGAGAPAPSDQNPKGEPMTTKFRIKGIETEDFAAVQAYIAELEARPTATEPFKFKLGGVEAVDPAAVQTHIDGLETFKAETITSARTGFVAKLAADKIITNPQKESFSLLVETMTPDQFSAFQKGWEGAQPANLFGTHGGEGGGNPDPKGDDAKKQAIADLEEIVANHRRAGKSDEEISKLKSYQDLQTLTASQAK